MRLGDTVEDYCSRCKRSMDHSIVAMMGEEIKKVRCRTCDFEHTYRKNRSGKKEMTAAEAFDKVLASVMTQQQQPPETKSKSKKEKS
jgi:formate dehydrogenase maturation protein FdhE